MPVAKPRLFFSYKHEERSRVVLAELKQLLDEDFTVDVDTNLRSGDQWHPTLERWLRSCDAAFIRRSVRCSPATHAGEAAPGDSAGSDESGVVEP